MHVCTRQGLLGGVLDRNKHVQEAACSALATLEEAAGAALEGRLQVVFWPAHDKMVIAV